MKGIISNGRIVSRFSASYSTLTLKK